MPVEIQRKHLSKATRATPYWKVGVPFVCSHCVRPTESLQQLWAHLALLRLHESVPRPAGPPVVSLVTRCILKSASFMSPCVQVSGARARAANHQGRRDCVSLTRARRSRKCRYARGGGGDRQLQMSRVSELSRETRPRREALLRVLHERPPACLGRRRDPVAAPTPLLQLSGGTSPSYAAPILALSSTGGGCVGG